MRHDHHTERARGAAPRRLPHVLLLLVLALELDVEHLGEILAKAVRGRALDALARFRNERLYHHIAGTQNTQDEGIFSGESWYTRQVQNIAYKRLESQKSNLSSEDYLSSGAQCHEALAASPACLRPLSKLQCTGEVTFHTPFPSVTRLASLWRQLAIEMREFDDSS